jgi:hypothetical protein
MRARHVLPAALSLALACGHGEPYGVPPEGTGQPYQGGAPTRLTYNPLADRDPTWVPDGSGILYSAGRADHDSDTCLMLLPNTGGAALRTICNDDAQAADSVKAYAAAALSPGGRFAMERTSKPPNQAGARYDELAMGMFSAAPAAATLLSIPFTVSGKLYTGISHIRWIDESALAFRADFAGTVCITGGSPCGTAFVTSGLDLMIQPLGSAGPIVIPGTAFASSVAASPDGDTLYYTVNADSRVFRRVVSAGTTGVFLDFGAGAVVRDVQVAAGRMVVVIGGDVRALSAPDSTPVQYDLGGFLDMVDLASATVTPISGAVILYAHPALSPDGKHLVAESNGDLWLFDLP